MHKSYTFFKLGRFILLMLLIQGTAVHAQEYKKKNILKANSLSLIFNNATMLYERSFAPRFTASLGIGYKYKSRPPAFYFDDEYASIHLQMGDIRGFSISPEVRYYLKYCEDTYPSGFYTGLYYRFTSFESDLDIRYVDDAGVEYYYQAGGNLDEHGVGFQLGYQLHVNKWLVLDFLIMGPRFSFYKVNMAFDENINEEFIPDAEIYLQNFVDKFEIARDVELDEIDFKHLKSKFEFLNFRYGLSIGIAF